MNDTQRIEALAEDLELRGLSSKSVKIRVKRCADGRVIYRVGTYKGGHTLGEALDKMRRTV